MATDVFVTLFITINPIAVLATYISMTSGYTPSERSTILRQGLLFALAVLTATVFAGNIVLELLGLERYALQIAGGILFFKFGWEAMQKTAVAEMEESPSGLVPLGFPVIAGPGSITAIILLSSNGPGLTPVLLSAILVCMLITSILLWYAEPITNRLGRNATNAIVKITGMLIITLGIQLVLSGISVWAGT